MAALFVHLQVLHPVGVRVVRYVSELFVELLHAFLGSLSLYLLIVSGEALHLYERRQLVYWRVVDVCLCVELSVKVQAYQVEGVAELASAWVCAVV